MTTQTVGPREYVVQPTADCRDPNNVLRKRHIYEAARERLRADTTPTNAAVPNPEEAP